MSTIYEYAYYIDGRKIAILSKGSSSTYVNDTNLTLLDIWVTPENDDSDAIMLEYTSKISAPTSETESINVNEYLTLAIEDYVRFKLSMDKYNSTSDARDLKNAQTFYGRFRNKIWENEHNKLGGHRQAIPTGVGV